MHCILTTSKEYQDLKGKVNTDERTLKGAIAVWQEENGLDNWPTPADIESIIGVPSKPISQLEDKIKGWLSKMGIEYKSVGFIQDDKVDNPVARASMLAKVLEVVEGRRDVTTLPEEAAHFLVELLPEDNLLLKTMLSKVEGTKIYAEVLAEYGEAYGWDEMKLRKEAVGKLIAQEVVKLYEKTTETEANRNWINKTFNAIINWLKAKTKNIVSSADVNTELEAYQEAAKLILDEQATDDFISSRGLKKSSETVFDGREEIYYYQISAEAKISAEELVKKLGISKVKAVSGGYQKSDGTMVKYRPTYYVDQFYSQVFSTGHRTDLDSKARAHIGTVLHEFESTIMNKIIAGENPTMVSTIAEVKAKLMSDPEFKAENNKYKFDVFSLGSTATAASKSFTEMVSAAKKLKSQIEANTDMVNKLAGTKGNATILTEITLYDESEDIAGTIDLLVVYPNGTVGIYDYKSMKFNQYTQEVSNVKMEAFKIQLDRYKRMLTRAYGVKDFAETRIIPLNVDFNEKTQTFHGVEVGGSQYGIKDREYLDQIPINELTLSDEFNKKVLHNLYLYQDKLRAILRKDYTNDRVQARLRRIDQTIKKMLLYKDIDYIADELQAISDELDMREKVDSTSPNGNGITDEIIREMNEFISVFDNLATEYALYRKGDLSKEATKKLSDIHFTIGVLKSRLMTKTQELINKVEPDINIDKPHKQLGFFSRIFSPLNELRNPAFQKIAKLIRDISWNVKTDLENLVKEMEGKRDNLEAWAKRNNMSLIDAYTKLINPNTGNLQGKYSKKYYEDKDKYLAEGGKELSAWINKYHKFDMEGFRKARLTKIADLNARFPGKTNDRFRDIKLAEWDKKYDAVHSDAAITTKNRFFTINDSAIPKTYLSDAYNYMSAPGNEALKEFHDAYVQYNLEFGKITGKEIDRNFVAEVRQDMISRITQNGVGSIFHMKSALLDSFEIRQEDAVSGSFDPTTGDLIPTIPLLYTDKIKNKATPAQIAEAEAAASKLYTKGSDDYLKEIRNIISRMERENGLKTKSKDLFYNLVLFAKSAYSYQYLKDTEAYVNNLRYYMQNGGGESLLTDGKDKPMVNKFTNKAMSVLGMAKNDIELLDNFVNGLWYGRSTLDKDKVVGDTTLKDSEGNPITSSMGYSSNKMVRGLLSYVSIKSLGLNPFVAAGNLIGSRANLYMIASEGKYFTSEQVNRAHKLSVSDRKKYTAAAELFQPYAHNIGKEMANNVSASTLEKALTIDNAFILMKKPDEQIDKLVLNSMMQNYGLNESGRITRLSKLPKDSKSLYDLFQESDDGSWSIPNTTSEEMARFRSMVQKQSTAIKGSVAPENKASYTRQLAGNVLMHFRGWMPGLISTRFKGLEYDPLMEDLDVGRFRVLFGEIVNSGGFLNGMKEFATLIGEATITGYFGGLKKINTRATQIAFDKFKSEHPEDNTVTLEDFIELRKSKIRGLATELRVYFLMMMLMMLTKAMIPDDDKEKLAKFFARNGYMMANRGFLETSFFLQPSSVKQILKQPIPAASVLWDLESWGKNLASESYQHISGDINKKDRTPFGYYTAKMIPLGKPITDLFDVFGTFKTK